MKIFQQFHDFYALLRGSLRENHGAKNEQKQTSKKESNASI